jgi:hypothetical protein
MAISLAIGLAACPAIAADEARRCGELPAPVAATRERILAAARDGALERLAALADAKDFQTTKEDGTGPLSYWKGLAADGIDAAKTIAGLLGLGCSVATVEGQPLFTWPAAVDLPYGKLTAGERKALAALNGGRLASVYVGGTQSGYYAGWQIEIAADGRWIAFTAGD